jgi:hypothetical protein
MTTPYVTASALMLVAFAVSFIGLSRLRHETHAAARG